MIVLPVISRFEEKKIFSDIRLSWLGWTVLSDYPELNQKAAFPCARFEIKRNKTEHWVHSIVYHSPYLAPEVKLPHYSKAYQKVFEFPSDGEIFTLPYDKLRARISGENV